MSAVESDTILSVRYQIPSALVLFKVQRPDSAYSPEPEIAAHTQFETVFEKKHSKGTGEKVKSSEMPSTRSLARGAALSGRCVCMGWGGLTVAAFLLVAPAENRNGFIGCFHLV